MGLAPQACPGAPLIPRLIAGVTRHRVFSLYVLSLLWLVASFVIFCVSAGRELRNVLLLVALVSGVVLCYIVFWRGLCRIVPSLESSAAPDTERHLTAGQQRLLLGLVIAYLSIVAVHFLLLGRIPLFEALFQSSEMGVSVVRQEGYFGLPIAWRYASDYCAKAFGPTLLLIAYYYRSRLFWVALVIGGFYSLALFARILPVFLLSPLVIYMGFQRRWMHLALTLALMISLVLASTAVSSPTIRESMQYQEPVVTLSDKERVLVSDYVVPRDDWRRSSAVYALYERALLVPGQVIDQWFYYYRDPGLREAGCGYRLLAGLLGCEYVPIPSKLYTAFYHDNVSQGMRGSLNAASFMTEYANFGPVGFLLSSLLGAGLFAIIMLIYRDHPLALPLNLVLIVAAMETSLVTAVNSGAGWLLTTALFIIFFRLQKAEHERKR